MWLYLWLLALPLILWLGERFGGRWTRVCYILIGLCLLLFLGLRRQIGCDWNNYLLAFSRARSNGLLEGLSLAEPGYAVLAWAVSHLGLGFGILNLLYAALLTTGLLLFVRGQARPALALLIATPVIIIILGLGATRQSAAVALFMWALHAHANGRRRVAAALCMLAPIFHWTGVLVLPFAALIFLDRYARFWFCVAAAAVASAAALMVAPFVPSVSMMLAAIVAEGGLYRAVPTLGALAIALYLAISRRLAGADELPIGYLSAIAIFALALAPISPTITDRLGFYAVPLQIAVFTRFPDLFTTRRLRVGAAASVASAYLLLTVAWLALTTQEPCLSPYRSYLSNPSMLFTSADESPWIPCSLSPSGDLVPDQ